MENQKIKNECLRRMKALKLHDEGEHTCVGDFRKNGNVWKSEFHGILYWLDEDEEKIVKDFEKEHEDYKVYHCIKSYTQFGEMLALLYVNGKKQQNELLQTKRSSGNAKPDRSSERTGKRKEIFRKQRTKET